MKRPAIVILCSLALLACSSAEDRARKSLEANLNVIDELELHDVNAYPGEVVCGSYSATTSYLEGRKKKAPFIVRGQELETSPSSRDWKIFCQQDPAAALLQQTGVGPFAEHTTALLKITQDLLTLETALEAYYKDTFEFPTTEQGLDSLLSPPEGLLRRGNYREGGYLPAIPVDPWGRRYIYEHVRWAGTRGRYSITTLGRAGTPGGEGADADVSYNDLPYLEHVATAQGLK